jgi:hypothetical protein
MGMLGHAAVLRDDLSVFAHLHPTGSVPMAALMAAVDHSHMQHHLQGLRPPRPSAGAQAPASLPSEIGFPWVFPKPGRYRGFVQFKRSGKIETAAFDLTVG